MNSKRELLLSLFLFFAVALGLLGASGVFTIDISITSSPTPTLANTYKTALLKPVFNGGEQRFSDIAANPYSPSYEKSFKYDLPSLARLRYNSKSSSFEGKLSVSHLKPNFAYQIKLLGTAKDMNSLEKLGYRGRWLLPGSGTNYSDEDYRKLKDKTLAESYIFFDWFVTDGDGNAEKEFYLDTCNHVLMNLTLENAIPTDPTILKKFTVGLFKPPAYHRKHKTKEVGIWALSEKEWSGTRPAAGELKMIEGDYSCKFVLTEESFHGIGGGFWATAMETEVEFTIERDFQD